MESKLRSLCLAFKAEDANIRLQGIEHLVKSMPCTPLWLSRLPLLVEFVASLRLMRRYMEVCITSSKSYLQETANHVSHTNIALPLLRTFTDAAHSAAVVIISVGIVWNKDDCTRTNARFFFTWYIRFIIVGTTL